MVLVCRETSGEAWCWTVGWVEDLRKLADSGKTFPLAECALTELVLITLLAFSQ
jgi:hypothetical protein